MPTLEDINKIKSQILEIGHEPSILSERGETPVDVEPPESGIPEDLNELLGDSLESFDLEDDTDVTNDFFMDDLEALEADLGMGEQEESSGESEEVVPSEPVEDTENLGFPEESLEETDDMALPEGESEEEFDLGGLEDDFSFENEISPAEDSSLEEGLPGEEDFSLDESLDESAAPEQETASQPGEEIGEFDLSMDDGENLDLEEFEVADEDMDLDDESFEVDEFDLGDLGQDFGVLEEPEDLSFTPPPESPFGGTVSQADTGEAVPGEEAFELSDEDFKKLTATLNTLPRNLKLVIEEAIGEKNLSGDKLQKLTDALVAGKSPKEIASITGKVTGRRIKIPSGYEKKSGIHFEEERNTFEYRFKHVILPLVRRIIIAGAVVAALTFAGYKFVYNPIYSLILYNKGYNALEENNFIRANEYFDRASEKSVFKKQFYRYADGYIERKQWTYAEDKYERLIELYPYDKKGTLDYAAMEYRYLFDYRKASDLLEKFIDVPDNATDFDALLLYGDVNLDWGGEDPDRYEVARRAYARLMKNYGATNTLLMRMMKYFIRTDDYEQVEILKNRFQSDKELIVDPYVYAELAEYQINKNDISDVKEILFRAKEVDSSLPEIHYQLSRYFRKINDPVEEDKAIAQTLHYLDEKEPLSMKQKEIKIDTYRRAGERSYAKKEYLQAQEYYEKGISYLNESRKLSVVQFRDSKYGKLYADLGDIYYFQGGDMKRALVMYNTAEKEEYHSDDVYYKKGFIYYRFREYKKALLDFYNAAGTFSTNTNLLLATSDTLYRSNDLFLAEGYYNHLLDILENRLYAETPLQLSFREDHRKLLRDLIVATNNMGVVQYGLYERTGDPEKFTQALVCFTEAGDYFDTLTRDPETMERTQMRNLSFLNQKKLLYPLKGYSLEIYGDIQKDMYYMSFD
ncbi:MAG: hypothetical protein DRP59_03765 [Spirochaetes bacterium]|nr:MAG: hypothetical protein DRP59_03765 [Spirochaetota bacterium]